MTDEKRGFLGSNRDLLLIAGLSMLVVAVYFQATGFAFINLDDNLYVYGNDAVTTGLNWNTVKWAFESFWAANWHPLTWLSHALDVQLFGVEPGMHHGVNVLFHLVNTILVFVVLRKMTGREWESAIVAALFAVHPAHVESVAWVSERKDVLSTMFWLLAMLAYSGYARSVKGRESAGENEVTKTRSFTVKFSSPRYILTVLFVALGLMAKPMLVTLPFVLLLCDLWPLARLRKIRDIIPLTVEKVPLLLLSAVSSVVTYWAQGSVGAIQSLDNLSMVTRLTNAAVSYGKYIVMLFYPADLAVLYPLDANIPTGQIGAAIFLLTAVTALSVWQIKSRPYLIVGWLWFLGTLVPVIGVVQVGSQALADRYTYVPYIGLFIMLTWGASSFARDRGFSKYAALSAAAVAIIVFSGLAWNQARYWRDNESLFKHTLAVTGRNGLVSLNLCHHLMLLDRLDEAEPYCREAIEIIPDNPETYNTLGVVQYKRGQFAEAEASFKGSLEHSPNYVYPWINIAQAQSRQGKPEEAEESIRTAVELNRGAADQAFVSALSDIASVYAQQQKFEKSVENYNRLIYLQSDNAKARAGLAASLFHLRKYDDAQAQAEAALSQKADLPEAWSTLGLVLLEKKKYREAADAFQKVIQLKPDFPDARSNLEKAERAS